MADQTFPAGPAFAHLPGKSGVKVFVVDDSGVTPVPGYATALELVQAALANPTVLAAALAALTPNEPSTPGVPWLNNGFVCVS